MFDLISKQHLTEVTDQLVRTYSDHTGTHYLDTCPLPHRRQVLQVLDYLRDLLFPGYHGRERLNLANVRFHAGSILDQVHDILSSQIYRALCHTRKGCSECTPQFRAENERDGAGLAIAFLEKLPELRQTLALDAEAAFAGDPACRSVAEVIFCYPGFEAVAVFRIASELHRLGVPLIPRMMTEHVHSRTGIDIHPGATIGKYFFIDHGTGVVIGETCVIGDWVKLYQGVTLGALSFPRNEQGELLRNTRRHPTIEDNVVIYANATVLGGETVVGKGSVIGSSVWLTESVPAGSTVTMEKPALRVKTKSDNIQPR